MSMTHKEMIEVIAAHEHGAQIDCRPHDSSSWIKTCKPTWSFSQCDYRVAPPVKVKMWQWLWKLNGDDACINCSNSFYPNAQKAQQAIGISVHIIGPAKWTEIEVDAT